MFLLIIYARIPKITLLRCLSLNLTRSVIFFSGGESKDLNGNVCAFNTLISSELLHNI